MNNPCVLLIGNFDGIHSGHRHRIERARPLGSVAVVTFSNHPKTFFHPAEPHYILSTEVQKISYLKHVGVEHILSLSFTEEIANMTATAFLTFIKKRLPFTDLMLSEHEAIGRNRHGTKTHLETLQEPLSFRAHFEPKIKQGAKTISSTAIRTAIQLGHLARATSYLGRPYVLQGTLLENQQLLLPPYCLPPKGNYRVKTKVGEKTYEDILTINDTLSLQATPSGEIELQF